MAVQLARLREREGPPAPPLGEILLFGPRIVLGDERRS
jgi:hypothetical protein